MVARRTIESKVFLNTWKPKTAIGNTVDKFKMDFFVCGMEILLVQLNVSMKIAYYIVDWHSPLKELFCCFFVKLFSWLCDKLNINLPVDKLEFRIHVVSVMPGNPFVLLQCDYQSFTSVFTDDHSSNMMHERVTQNYVNKVPFTIFYLDMSIVKADEIMDVRC